jgi:hypothetical protein
MYFARIEKIEELLLAWMQIMMIHDCHGFSFPANSAVPNKTFKWKLLASPAQSSRD